MHHALMHLCTAGHIVRSSSIKEMGLWSLPLDVISKCAVKFNQKYSQPCTRMDKIKSQKLHNNKHFPENRDTKEEENAKCREVQVENYLAYAKDHHPSIWTYLFLAFVGG